MNNLNGSAVIVIGGGLAGSEAAWQLVKRGIPVLLYEMRPQVSTPVHKTEYFAELVCSNSLRSDDPSNAVGLLKEEMRRLDSIIMRCADTERIPAGSALAVDRDAFAKRVTTELMSHSLLTVNRQEMVDLDPEQYTIIASGPLTSERLAQSIQKLTGKQYFYFYDASAPIVTADSLDEGQLFWGSRYDKGDRDYLNAGLNQEQYEALVGAMLAARVHETKDFEEKTYFEGCMPVEALAARGRDTLRFGPLKPVGLSNPLTGQRPYAVVQLRRDNHAGTLFNLVGFQTQLAWPEQDRIFRMIPGLERAEFVRYGVMHKNCFINSPEILMPTLQMHSSPHLLFAGQLTGVEGYVESAATGLIAGINMARIYNRQEPLIFPAETAHGALCHYITSAESRSFQPMNVAFGLFPALPHRIRDRRERNRQHAQRALKKIEDYIGY